MTELELLWDISQTLDDIMYAAVVIAFAAVWYLFKDFYDTIFPNG